jgi:hypothetical protein
MNIKKGDSIVGRFYLIIIDLIQYSASLTLIAAMIQVVFFSMYSLWFVQATIGISLIGSCLILVILCLRFVRALRYQMSAILLAYLVANASLSSYVIVTFIHIKTFLDRKQDIIAATYNPWASFSSISPDFVFLSPLVGVVSFVSMWMATVLLTIRYSKTKRTRKWVMVSVPMIYFASQFFLPFLEDSPTVSEWRAENNALYVYGFNTFFGTLRMAGGIMFGFAFLALSRTVNSHRLKNSMILIGIGLAIVYGTDISTIIGMALFPPWGVLSTTFLITGSLCIMIGLDSSAFYLATDSSLRKIIQRMPNRNYDFIKQLGQLRIQESIEKKVQKISSKIYDEVESERLLKVSSEPEDVREYIRDVLKELQDKSNLEPLRDQKKPPATANEAEQ